MDWIRHVPCHLFRSSHLRCARSLILSAALCETLRQRNWGSDKVVYKETDPESSAAGIKMESCPSPDSFSHFLTLPVIQMLKILCNIWAIPKQHPGLFWAPNRCCWTKVKRLRPVLGGCGLPAVFSVPQTSPVWAMQRAQENILRSDLTAHVTSRAAGPRLSEEIWNLARFHELQE